MGGARRNAGQPANLIESQTAPEMGDDDFPFIKWKDLQSGGRFPPVDGGAFRRREPMRSTGRGDRFMPMTPTVSAGGARRRIAHDTK